MLLELVENDAGVSLVDDQILVSRSRVRSRNR
jgi:hypothetical protein